MDTTRITPKPNGPLIVEGPVKIVTPDGRELAVPPRKDGRPAEVVVLCRCGGAATKPFCDGSHKRNGFSEAPPPDPAPPNLGPRTSLPRFEHGVLCCLRPGRGCAGGAAPDHTRCTPPPAVPPKEERNGEGW